MRNAIILSVLLGAGAIAHPHYKLNNPLAHHHHKRQDPIVAVEYLKNAQGQTTEVLDIAEAVSTVYEGGASPPTPAAAAQVDVNADYHVGTHANPPTQAEKASSPQAAPAPPAAPAPAPKAAAAPAPAPAPVKVAAPVEAAAPVKAAAPVEAAPPASGATIGGQNVLDVANKWRAKQGLGTFTWDDDLAGVSANTNSANGANSMTHHNTPPSLGQVIAQGSSSLTGPSSQGELGPVDLLWLGWICELSGEIPDFPCSEATDATHMNTNGETIHAQILMNGQYTKLGCNYMDATDPASQVWPDKFQGMFTCDVA